jgi:hypothetical protein
MASTREDVVLHLVARKSPFNTILTVSVSLTAPVAACLAAGGMRRLRCLAQPARRPGLECGERGEACRLGLERGVRLVYRLRRSGVAQCRGFCDDCLQECVQVWHWLRRWLWLWLWLILLTGRQSRRIHPCQLRSLVPPELVCTMR